MVDYERLAPRPLGIPQGPATTDVTLECFDARGLSVQRSLEVKVTDVNEAPRHIFFDMRYYNTTIEENKESKFWTIP